MLAHGPEALDRDEPPDPPALHRLARGLDRGVEAAVVADREHGAVRRGHVHEGPARFKGVGDRLFHQHRQPALGAGDADFRVGIGRGGDDRAVDRLAVQQLPEVAIKARAVAPGDRRRRLPRVRDRDDLALRLLAREPEMARADAARAEQRQSNRIAHARPLYGFMCRGGAAAGRRTDRGRPRRAAGLFDSHAHSVKRDMASAPVHHCPRCRLPAWTSRPGPESAAPPPDPSDAFSQAPGDRASGRLVPVRSPSNGPASGATPFAPRGQFDFHTRYVLCQTPGSESDSWRTPSSAKPGGGSGKPGSPRGR